MTTLEKLTKEIIKEGLVESEYVNDNVYIENMLVSFGDLPYEFDGLELSHEVTNGDSGDYWNEIRDEEGRPLDLDAPEELTVKEWAEYFDRLKEHKSHLEKTSIIIPITESDIEDLKAGNEFRWTFEGTNGITVDVHIKPE